MKKGLKVKDIRNAVKILNENAVKSDFVYIDGFGIKRIPKKRKK